VTSYYRDGLRIEESHSDIIELREGLFDKDDSI